MATVIAALGDSISAGTPAYDPNPQVAAEFGRDDERSQWEYWAQKRYPGLEVRNFGVNRETTAQIASRLEQAIVGADWLVVQGGINDVVDRLPVSESAANIYGMVRDAKARGLGVLLAEVLPWNQGYEGSAELIRRLNEEIRRIGQDEGVRVLPFYAVLEDPDIPGRLRSEWTADGSHPSVEGHRRLGEVAFTWP